MTKIYLLVLFLVFSFGQLIRLEPLGAELVIHPLDFLVGIGVIWWAIRSRKIGNSGNRKIFVAGLIWLGLIGISLLVNFHNFTIREMVIACLYPIRFFVYFGFFFFLCQKKKYFPDIKRYLILSFILVAIIGLVQYFLLPNVSFLAASEWDDHYYRLTAPFLDPGLTGMILLAGLMFDLKTGIFKNIKTLLFFVAFMLTYSRASYLAYLVGFSVLAVYQKSIKIFLVATIVLLVSVYFLPGSSGEGTKLGRENSIQARITNWKQSIAVWQTSPLLGVGFNTYRYAQHASLESHAGAGADSSILLTLATTGILGALAYLGILIAIFQQGKKDAIFTAVFAGILVHSWFNNTLFYAPIMFLMWTMLALRTKEKT